MTTLPCSFYDRICDLCRFVALQRVTPVYRAAYYMGALTFACLLVRSLPHYASCRQGVMNSCKCE